MVSSLLKLDKPFFCLVDCIPMYVYKRFNKTLHLFEIIILYIVLCFNVGVFEVVVKVSWEFEPFPVVCCI